MRIAFAMLAFTAAALVAVPAKAQSMTVCDEDGFCRSSDHIVVPRVVAPLPSVEFGTTVVDPVTVADEDVVVAPRRRVVVQREPDVVVREPRVRRVHAPPTIHRNCAITPRSTGVRIDC